MDLDRHDALLVVTIQIALHLSLILDYDYYLTLTDLAAFQTVWHLS